MGEPHSNTQYAADVAAVYDSDSHGIYARTYNQVMDLLPKDARVRSALDIGAGTGSMLERLRARFPDASLIGLDVAPAMLERATMKVPGLVSVVGDYTAIKTEPALRDLDLVLANYVLSYTEPPLLMSLAHEALADDGLFVVSTTTMRSFEELRNVANHWIFKLISMGYDISGETADGHLPPNPDDEAHLVEMLTGAGFEVVAHGSRADPIHLNTGRDLFNFGYEGGWFLSLFQKLGVTERTIPHIHMSLRASQLLRLIPKPLVSSMETVVAVARRKPR